jgi:hypothetical protein
MAIRATTEAAYRTILDVLHEEQLEGHTFQYPENRKQRFIVRNLATNTSIDDIVYAFSLQGVDVSTVH